MRQLASGQTQLFIGLHLVHEVTSPQAFQMLRERGLKVRFPERTFATVDHIVPTDVTERPFIDSLAEAQRWFPCSLSGFMAKHIEHPAPRHSKPAS